jgi:hypothetical protein
VPHSSGRRTTSDHPTDHRRDSGDSRRGDGVTGSGPGRIPERGKAVAVPRCDVPARIRSALPSRSPRTHRSSWCEVG